MNVYLDSSVVLRWMLRQAGAIRNWGAWSRPLTSQLTQIEARRTLDRLRVSGLLSDTELAAEVAFLRAVLARFEEVPILPRVLERAASPFPTQLGTLDAIHLASALIWTEERGEALTFLTHHRQLAIGAQACGLEIGLGQR